MKIAQIRTGACEFFELTRDELTGGQRRRVIARPRMIAMALSHEIAPRSLSEIGHAFGGRDHTTVLYAIRQVAHWEAMGEDWGARAAAFRAYLGFGPRAARFRRAERFGLSFPNMRRIAESGRGGAR